MGHTFAWAWVALLVCVILPAMAAAAWGHEGLVLRAFGVAVVGMDGNPASRFRKVGRTLAAWIPCLMAPLPLAVLTPWTGPTIASALVVGPLVVLTAVSAALPQRGIPDLMAGTCLVPE